MSPKRKDVSQGEDETPVKKGKRVELRKRLSRTASGRLNGNGSSTYGPKFTGDMITECTSDKLNTAVLANLLKHAITLSEQNTERSAFIWKDIDKPTLARVILKSFLNSTEYHKWKVDWISTNATSIYIKEFKEQWEPKDLVPEIDIKPPFNNSKWARHVITPFVCRIKRTTPTIFKDFIAFVMCKVYEFKEKNKSFEEALGQVIFESYTRFMQQIGIKLPVLDLPLEIPANWNDDEQSPMDQDDGNGDQENDDEKEDDEVLQDARKVNQLVAQFGAAVKQCEASTKAKLDLANAYVREFDDKRIQAEKTANQFRLAAEGVRGILQKMTDEEEERKLLEEMRIPEDNVEDIRRLETREKFIAQTIDVVFPNLTDQEREEFLSGKKELPWDRFEISFVSAEPV